MAEHVQPFAEMLEAITKSERVRAVVTIRHDFMPKAVENQIFSELFRKGFFSLSIPKRDALRLMIERPAERAGIVFDEALVARILDDTGDEPGNLALMAYALDELYKLDDDRHLTHAEYDALGGVQGAIGTRAENQFKALNMDDSVIQQVFHALVEVDERGTATRRREQFQPDDVPENVRDLIYAFTDARLLTTSYDEQTKTATVEVAHEAILRQWKRLADWIEATQDDHRTISRMKREARIWYERERPDFLLPNAEALDEFIQACDRLEVKISDDVLQDFTEPEQERLYRELENLPKDATSHERRRDIGDRLAVIGDTREGVGLRDDGLPDMAWIPITEGGEVTIEYGGSRFSGGDKENKSTTFEIKPFYIAKYQVTYAQYQAFADADYDNPQWWEGFPEDYRPQKLSG
ncbi:MAG: SUMF1/EgtB/PvdO family nonheme iron enzyme, partial [Chloroflexota bacterium]